MLSFSLSPFLIRDALLHALRIGANYKSSERERGRGRSERRRERGIKEEVEELETEGERGIKEIVEELERERERERVRERDKKGVSGKTRKRERLKKEG